jgi:DNA-binding LytR/AlgR family response regulator
MDNLIKILVVEDEMIIGAKISMQLETLGYEVTAILPRGEEAILHVKENKPDIILLDINLKGKLDGIETATQIGQQNNIPVIYLTANADEATFNRAKHTKPYAFISKPFKQLDLQRAIELTISRMAEEQTGANTEDNSNDENPFILSDRIFVRHKDKMVKIMVADILYIEADRNYCHIFTHNKEWVLSATLKTLQEKLPAQLFQRIHRSFLINLSAVDEVAENGVTIAQKKIPLGLGMREELMKRMMTL